MAFRVGFSLLPLVVLLASSSSFTVAYTDVDILNFALNLECLEATFYSYAAWGKGLSLADRGGGPSATGGSRAFLSSTVAQYAKAIATDEVNHVRYLRAALGPAAVACPAINVGSAFASAFNAAFGMTISPTVSAYGSDMLFLLGAFIFEDVGVTAYKGAAPLIKNKAYLEVAGGILATEAYHGGAIRQLLFQNYDSYVYPFRYKIETFAQKISDLRAAVSMAADDQGVIMNGSVVLAPTDDNAIAFSRSTSQVLPIVYLGGTTKGGFFPKGLNGFFK